MNPGEGIENRLYSLMVLAPDNNALKIRWSSRLRGIESLNRLAGAGALAPGQVVELFERRTRLNDHRQCLQIATVRGDADIAIPKQVGHAFAHRKPRLLRKWPANSHETADRG